MANGNPVIGYQNYLDTYIAAGGTLTATSEVAGFEIENVHSGFTFDYWKPTLSSYPSFTLDMAGSVEVNYFALAAFSLGVVDCQITLRYSTDNFAASNNVVAQVNVLAGNPFLVKLPQTVVARYWRISFLAPSVQPIVGVAHIGMAMEIPEGLNVQFTPPHLSMDDNVLNNKSQGGAFIGRSVQQYGSDGSISLSDMDAAWVRGEWLPFLEHARLKPFFLDWSDRWMHNLIKHSEDVRNSAWFLVNITAHGTWIESPEESYGIIFPTSEYSAGPAVPLMSLDTSTAVFRQNGVIPYYDVNQVYTVSFYVKVVAGVITSSNVDIANGTSKPFTITDLGGFSNWELFTLQVTPGTSTSGNLDINFAFSSAPVLLAITQVQTYKGAVSIPYQKTTNSVEEAAYCWTDGAITPPQYSQPGRMNCSLKFKALTR